MIPRSIRTQTLVIILLLAPAGLAEAQQASPLPRSRADVLIEEGRWSEAEDLLYSAARARPRDPVVRASLGRYLAMKGALKPGLVLIEEAAEFGLPAATTRALARPIRTLIDWRRQEAEEARDSAFTVRPPADDETLLRFPVVRRNGRDTLWADLVPRMIGLDSARGANPRVGIEVLEGLVPAYDAGTQRLRLHADPRAALSALGRRFPVLRTSREVSVLVGQGRVLPLPVALRELGARWWQLDLAHGLLVVR